jgi:hypothetical protein
MKYTNATDKTLTVPTALGDVSVAPGEAVLTAPKFAQSLVDAGKLKIVKPRQK